MRAAGVAAAVAVSLGILTGAAAVAVAWSQLPRTAVTIPGSEPAAPPAVVAPSAVTVAPSPLADRSPAQPPSGRGIAQLADPAWVASVSQRAGIPARPLAAYAGAALQVHRDTGCSVGWNNLAAIGLVETAHGSFGGSTLDAAGVARPAIIGVALNGTGVARIADTDGGVLDGDTTWDRAVGPMQFIPESWRRSGADGNGDGATDPQQIDDAALAAAHYLCDASGGLTDREAWLRAIASYNRSDDYRDRVAQAAAGYAAAAAG